MTDIASIGFKMETDDVARGIKSLESLAQQGPKVEKALDGVEKTVAKAGKSLKSIGDRRHGQFQQRDRAGKRIGYVTLPAPS